MAFVMVMVVVVSALIKALPDCLNAGADGKSTPRPRKAGDRMPCRCRHAQLSCEGPFSLEVVDEVNTETDDRIVTHRGPCDPSFLEAMEIPCHIQRHRASRKWLWVLLFVVRSCRLLGTPSLSLPLSRGNASLPRGIEQPACLSDELLGYSSKAFNLRGQISNG
mmetsp:Transcript_29589/g.58048  ORF Transcript_29589/g.58048 Transcript_29589/m.58048 type:complete len:164 (+) Transcript_29589:31-522(+)